MPPLPSPLPWLSSIFPRSQSQTHASFAAVKAQWQNPTDILTILTIIGGDVVQRAIAQMSGGSSSRYITPVAFSFGWVSYSFAVVLSAIGSGKLMPEPEVDITCINVKSGYPRDVKSWVLGRLFRDLVPKIKRGQPAKGLTVVFYRTHDSKHTGDRDRDWVYWLGIAVIVLQLGISCIPGGLQGNWVILIITAGGILLTQISGLLPQWRREMWAARKLGAEQTQVVCLTAGNGSSHALVIKSEGCGHNLEDLAGGRITPSPCTTYATVVLAFLWIVHLMTVQGVEHDGWYLLAIGGIGMVQNVISAGVRRSAGALGFHMKEYKSCHEEKVFDTLKAAEEEERWAGLRLLDVFFPGGLRPDEKKWADDREADNKRKDAKEKAEEKERKKARELEAQREKNAQDLLPQTGTENVAQTAQPLVYDDVA